MTFGSPKNASGGFYSLSVYLWMCGSADSRVLEKRRGGANCEWFRVAGYLSIRRKYYAGQIWFDDRVI
jgi:hypothetical protein